LYLYLIGLNKKLKNHFLKNKNIRVIHNGIDLDKFKIQNTENVNKKYNLTNKFLILGVASP
jgi:glycosyltransferase involved in cell wall biosynthesis